MVLRLLFISMSCMLLLGIKASAQERVYYVFSNLTGEMDDELYQLYLHDVNNTPGKQTVLSLGDNKISNLLKLKESHDAIKVKFLTGNTDQNDLKNFKKLDHKKDFKYLTDGRYCPDPQIIEVDDKNIIISINSNWFLDRKIRFKAKDADCNTFNRADFFEELESIIDKNDSKNIIILAHHNTISNTPLGGKGLWPYDMIPVVGNLYASYKRNIGNQQDLTSANYQYYSNYMNKLASNDNVSIIAGHDHVNAIYQNNGLLSMNVNSGTHSYPIHKNVEHSIYQSRLPSYYRLSYTDEVAKLEVVNESGITEIDITPKTVTNVRRTSPPAHVNLKTSVQASKKYKSGKIKNWFFGSGYRIAWNTPVAATPLNLEERKLSPYSRGGGLQTQSVKLKTKDNQKFAFRALDKEPEKSLNSILQNSIYKDIVQELITTMHPYGPLVAYQLIKETDILHIKPELYIMSPNQDQMQEYSEFNNKLGTLEEKPKGKSKKREGYMGADDVVSTFQMLGDLTRNSKNRIDKLAFAKSRVFDMYIGDWDRHEDNWKWAMFEIDGEKIYKPIPKDRDHVFSKWTGIVPKAADFFVANAENFGYEFGNLRQLNFKAYHLDRQLATEITAEEWQESAEYIISIMTDDLIDQAMLAFPEEVRDLYSDEISAKLKSRKSDLERAVYIHYCNLAHDVDITGSNKRDIFDIVRNADGTVSVTVYSSNKSNDRKKKFYHRTFSPEFTSTIYCYGLDGEDEFNISGDASKSIKIRIIGGDETDHITDDSSVDGRMKLTQVYDSQDEDLIESSTKETKIKRPKRAPYYDPYAQGQNSILPIPSISKSSGNGWGIDVGLQYIIQGYNKPLFAKYYKVNALYYPEIGAYRMDASFRYRHFLGKSDFLTKLRVSDEYDKFPFFYGVGSETTFDHEAREDGLYRLDYDFGRYDIGLSKTFFTKSEFENTFFGEFHGIDAEENSGLREIDLPRNTFFYGYQTSLSLDFTDRTKYPTAGNKFNTSIETRISSNNKVTANISSDISYYKSIDLGVTTTLAAKIGYQASLGEANFYHLSSLGSNTGLQGYTRNRFLDKYATFYNTELRFDLGSIQTPIIQFNVGTFILFDGGKVWNDDITFNNNDWKNSYGIGFFLAPYSTEYAISFSLIHSEDYDVYTQFQLGFKF